MAKLFLDIALIHIGTGGKPGAQGMAGEQFQALGLWQVAADAGGQHGFLDQAGDVFVRQPISGGFAIIAADALEQRAKVDPGIVQVLLERMHRAGGITGAAANLNLAPAGFAAKRQDQPASSIAIQPLPSSVSSRLISRLTISERRRPPA